MCERERECEGENRVTIKMRGWIKACKHIILLFLDTDRKPIIETGLASHYGAEEVIPRTVLRQKNNLKSFQNKTKQKYYTLIKKLQATIPTTEILFRWYCLEI